MHTARTVITVADMVRTERAFLDELGIERLAAVAGGSLGGMQAFEWAIMFPDQVDAVVAIASTHACAFRDSGWNSGNKLFTIRNTVHPSNMAVRKGKLESKPAITALVSPAFEAALARVATPASGT